MARKIRNKSTRNSIKSQRVEANQKTICSVCKTPNTDGTFYCETCGNKIN